ALTVVKGTVSDEYDVRDAVVVSQRLSRVAKDVLAQMSSQLVFRLTNLEDLGSVRDSFEALAQSWPICRRSTPACALHGNSGRAARTLRRSAVRAPARFPLNGSPRDVAVPCRGRSPRSCPTRSPRTRAGSISSSPDPRRR